MVLGFDEINLASFDRHCSGQRNSSSFARNFHGAVVLKLSPTPHVYVVRNTWVHLGVPFLFALHAHVL